jgi:hypothetical protein
MMSLAKRYLRDPQLERNVHRSQNRIESYHQQRSIIAQVGGKMIDLDILLAGLDLGYRNFLGFRLRPPSWPRRNRAPQSRRHKHPCV